ncbi:hypothetical protein ACFYY1_33620 [Streptomyces sp. NPDC001890]|uniref:hypothetical protein n=1 Tax=Streptomyces sp. NPDC001890 TaxID=3364620 RepID=UPI0036B40AB5
MLKKLLKKIAIPGIEEAAGTAFKRGDAIFVYKFHPSPSPRNRDADLPAPSRQWKRSDGRCSASKQRARDFSGSCP